MKFLVDENLSPRLADALNVAGHDAVHTRAVAASHASDAEVMALASEAARVIISADTDFGAILAATRAAEPSVILVRGLLGLTSDEMARVPVANLDLVERDLANGAVVAFTRKDVRVRKLPLR